MDNVGKMDRRITVQTPTEARDDFGGFTTTWGTYCERWANLRYSRPAGESYPADRKTSIYTALFTIRRDSTTKDITAKMRISYDSKTWDIRAISEKADEFRKMYLIIEAEAKDA